MTRRLHREHLSVTEIFGLRPFRRRFAEALMAVRGQPEIPATRWGLSSARILKPWISLPTWLGRTRSDRRIPIYNLFNHTQTPAEEGWSVRVTQVRDYRGGELTYDSHNGTDFAVPTGTKVVAPADGRVLLLPNEFNRGGLKVVLDHGHGIATSSNHLARTLVEVGQFVRRGQPIGLSGFSGLDGFLFFPWAAPHVHFNVFLDGLQVDPFARSGEVSLWLGGEPRPAPVGEEVPYQATTWNVSALQRVVASCRNPRVRARLEGIPGTDALAAELLYQTSYYPTRFRERPRLYASAHRRRPILTLPFSGDDFIGIHYPDNL